MITHSSLFKSGCSRTQQWNSQTSELWIKGPIHRDPVGGQQKPRRWVSSPTNPSVTLPLPQFVERGCFSYSLNPWITCHICHIHTCHNTYTCTWSWDSILQTPLPHVFFSWRDPWRKKNTFLKPKGYSSTRHEGTIWKCIIMDRHLVEERRSTKRTASFYL